MPKTKPPGEGEAPADPLARMLTVALIAVVVGFVLSVGLNFGYTTWAIDQAHRQNAREAATAQHEGERVVRKICITLDKLHSNQPPPGNPAKNPSRRYLQQEHAILGELPGDIGC